VASAHQRPALGAAVAGSAEGATAAGAVPDAPSAATPVTAANDTDGVAAIPPPRVTVARTVGAVPAHDPIVTDSASDSLSSDDQSIGVSPSTQAAPVITASPITASPLGDQGVANPQTQSLKDVLPSHMTAPIEGDASAAAAQSGGITATPQGVDSTNAVPYAGIAGSGTTVDTVALRVARAVHDGTQTFSIELHPAELGRVEVRLSFHDGGVGVQMTLDRQETYAAFHRDRAALEQQLAQAGIDLGSGGLDLRYGQQSRQPQPQQASTIVRAAASTEVAPLDVGSPYDVSTESLVDIIA